MKFFSQIDRSTIEFGLISNRGERNTSIYTTTLLTDSFVSWLEFKISLSVDGLIVEMEIFGHIIGFEVLAVIEEDDYVTNEFSIHLTGVWVLEVKW